MVVEASKLGALGKYDCISNVIYVVPELGDKKSLTVFMAQDSNITFGSTEFHETWHWRQAQGYGGIITVETKVTEYMPWLNKKCKKNIEHLGITEYNVSDISDYAEDMFKKGRYDEVEAEYYTKLFVRRRK